MRRWVGNVFKRWKLTKKQISWWCENKFTLLNIRYYITYTIEIKQIDPFKIHYEDEAKFEDKDLSMKHGYAFAGQALVQQREQKLGHSYTAFALTDLRSPDGFVLGQFHTGNNNAVDYLEFILECLIAGHIQPGDYLVVDNASIHKSALILPILDIVFDFLDIKLIFLPTYSPELNPVESIWAHAKNYMRNNRGNLPYAVELLLAFTKIDFPLVASFYEHCLHNFQL
jgi:transposase